MCQFVSKLSGQKLEDYIVDAIELFRSKGENFTAHQVTKKVREMVGPTIEVDHLDVRSIVHDLMATTLDYIKDTQPGNPITYKFKKATPDFKSFVDAFNKLPVIKTPVVKRDARGSVVIPKAVIENTGGNSKFFKISLRTQNETRLVPVTSGNPTVGTLDQYRVYKGNIRVTKRNLPKGKNSFVVRVNNGGEICIQGVS